VRVVLATLKAAALGGLLTLMVVGGPQATAPSAQSSARTEADAYGRVVQRAAADHRCSLARLRHGAVPASALIRTTGGEVHQVSFEVGWDVYNGRRPGTLIAVCLDDPDPSELVQVYG
jgi:hypothetical protein